MTLGPVTFAVVSTAWQLDDQHPKLWWGGEPTGASLELRKGRRAIRENSLAPKCSCILFHVSDVKPSEGLLT